MTRFQKLRAIFQLLPRMTINLLLWLNKFASNMSCVTIQHRCLASIDLAWMVQANHLSCEASCFQWWVIFVVTNLVAMMNILDRRVLDIEAHTVPWKSFTQSFMVPFKRLYFNCNTGWSIVTTLPGFRTPVSTGLQGQCPYHLFCRHPEGANMGLSFGKLMAGCNTVFQAVWFHWHCHRYGWLSIPWSKAC